MLWFVKLCKSFVKTNHAKALLQTFRVFMVSPYNFVNLICTCLLRLKNTKFSLPIFFELILLKLIVCWMLRKKLVNSQ